LLLAVLLKDIAFVCFIAKKLKTNLSGSGHRNSLHDTTSHFELFQAHDQPDCYETCDLPEADQNIDYDDFPVEF
jgi:hypothetical protein